MCHFDRCGQNITRLEFATARPARLRRRLGQRPVIVSTGSAVLVNDVTATGTQRYYRINVVSLITSEIHKRPDRLRLFCHFTAARGKQAASSVRGDGQTMSSRLAANLGPGERIFFEDQPQQLRKNGLQESRVMPLCFLTCCELVRCTTALNFIASGSPCADTLLVKQPQRPRQNRPTFIIFQ